MTMCNCYVNDLDPEIQFGLHYGAHEQACPKYRVSRDPVDRKWDEIYRRDNEVVVPGSARYPCEWCNNTTDRVCECSYPTCSTCAPHHVCTS